MGLLDKIFGSHPVVDDMRDEAEYFQTAKKSGSGSYACLVVDDVFTITGRGTVATGQITEGDFTVGDSVILDTGSGEQIETVISGIEMFRKTVETAGEGENVGIFLKNIKRGQLSKGDLIIKR